MTSKTIAVSQNSDKVWVSYSISLISLLSLAIDKQRLTIMTIKSALTHLPNVRGRIFYSERLLLKDSSKVVLGWR